MRGEDAQEEITQPPRQRKSKGGYRILAKITISDEHRPLDEKAMADVLKIIIDELVRNLHIPFIHKIPDYAHVIFSTTTEDFEIYTLPEGDELAISIYPRLLGFLASYPQLSISFMREGKIFLSIQRMFQSEYPRIHLARWHLQKAEKADALVISVFTPST